MHGLWYLSSPLFTFVSFCLFLTSVLCDNLHTYRKEPKWPHAFFPLHLNCFKINLPHAHTPVTQFCFILIQPRDVLTGTWATLPQRQVITGGKSNTAHKCEEESFLRRKLQRENQLSWIHSSPSSHRTSRISAQLQTARDGTPGVSILIFSVTVNSCCCVLTSANTDLPTIWAWICGSFFFIPFSYSAGIILHIGMILSLDYELEIFKFRNTVE